MQLLSCCLAARDCLGCQVRLQRGWKPPPPAHPHQSVQQSLRHSRMSAKIEISLSSEMCQAVPSHGLDAYSVQACKHQTDHTCTPDSRQFHLVSEQRPCNVGNVHAKPYMHHGSMTSLAWHTWITCNSLEQASLRQYTKHTAHML